MTVASNNIIFYEINNMIEDKEIPEIPVFLDSPLALKVTGIVNPLNGFVGNSASLNSSVEPFGNMPPNELVEPPNNNEVNPVRALL